MCQRESHRKMSDSVRPWEGLLEPIMGEGSRTVKDHVHWFWGHIPKLENRTRGENPTRDDDFGV